MDTLFSLGSAYEPIFITYHTTKPGENITSPHLDSDNVKLIIVHHNIVPRVYIFTRHIIDFDVEYFTALPQFRSICGKPVGVTTMKGIAPI